jgi:hypothetical protein
MVKTALYGLRIYLLVLLALIAIKFYRVFSTPADQSNQPSVPEAKANQQ